MEIFTIRGGKPLSGTVRIGGAKNVALKILIASLLTDEPIVIHNVPRLRDVFSLIDVLESLGVQAVMDGNTIRIQNGIMKSEPTVPLDLGARLRTSTMVLGPLLARYGKGHVPNPGGCRLGARPIDRHVEGLKVMGADISYDSDDGYFHASAPRLHGATIRFPKNTHTGTETILLAAVLAEGRTVIENAAAEVEVDDLISCLTSMGANIRRTDPRTIVIEGVAKLNGTEFTIMPDRNEEVTFAIAAAMTGGSVIVDGSQRHHLQAFLDMFVKAGGIFEPIDETHTRYSRGERLLPTRVETAPHPGFMTDWQAPWSVFMTQADGVSTVHERVFESRFSYVTELEKMGADIGFYSPEISDPETYYNFNWQDRNEGTHQAIRITGPTELHDAVLTVNDIRAGASLLLAALVAEGRTYLNRVELIDRGYESIEMRLTSLGADIQRSQEEDV